MDSFRVVGRPQIEVSVQEWTTRKLGMVIHMTSVYESGWW
jgi:hypothetical protein